MNHTKDASHSFDPPPTFSLVHPGLYRSSSHHFTNHSPYFRSLRLTSILLLGLELPNAALKAWCDKQGVRLVHLPSEGQHSSWHPIPEETVKEGLEHVLDKDNLPCLVMDPSGIYETGMLVGCLRKLERWTLSSILAEYASIAGSKTRPSNEQFIELFDTDLVVLPPPDQRPAWFAPTPAEADD